jgi:hypothetical protein
MSETHVQNQVHVEKNEPIRNKREPSLVCRSDAAYEDHSAIGYPIVVPKLVI